MTKEFVAIDRRTIWHPYTKWSSVEAGPLPVIVRGEGPYLYDEDGRRYVDVISSWWAVTLGHSHPRIVEAIRRQAGELQHSILGNMTHPRAIELAERLVGLFPSAERRVLFSSDGASAVEAALKVAVQYWYNVGRPEKHRFASFEGGYHGDTLGSVSVGYIGDFHRPFQPLLFPSYRVEAPCCGTCKFGCTGVDDCDLACFGAMAEVIESHAAELAAVVVEPLCRGAAGMRMYSARYLQRLAALCAERDVLLIVDEVATGFGRTGTMFAFEQASVDPDIVCLGKSLSAGTLPISATVVKASIHDTFRDEPVDRTFYHGHTFAGNPIAAAAAVEALRVYEEERIHIRAEAMGENLRGRMQRFRDLPGIRNVRCLGMIGTVELEPEPGRAERIRRAMLEAGYLARPLGDVFYTMLPITVPVPVLEETVDALYKAVEAEVT